MKIETRPKMLIVSALLVLSGFALGFYIGTLKSKSSDESSTMYAIIEAKTKDAHGKKSAEKIYGRDVLEKISDEIDQLERQKYALKRRATEELIRAKLSPPDENPADAKSLEVTAADLNAFFKERGLVRSKLTAKQIEDVIGNLRVKKLNAQKQSQAAERLATYDIRYKIPLPPMKRLDLASGKVAVRDSGRPIKILFVGNFHCPTCASAEGHIEELRALYKDRVEVAYRFLLTNEPDKSIVRTTAEAALCANDQKKFWEFHDAILHGALGKPALLPSDVASLSAVGKNAGLELSAFEACVSARKHKADVEKEVATSLAAGLSEAPVIVVNGYPRHGAESVDQFTPLIDAEL